MKESAIYRLVKLNLISRDDLILVLSIGFRNKSDEQISKAFSSEGRAGIIIDRLVAWSSNEGELDLRSGYFSDLYKKAIQDERL